MALAALAWRRVIAPGFLGTSRFSLKVLLEELRQEIERVYGVRRTPQQIQKDYLALAWHMAAEGTIKLRGRSTSGSIRPLPRRSLGSLRAAGDLSRVVIAGDREYTDLYLNGRDKRRFLTSARLLAVAELGQRGT